MNPRDQILQCLLDALPQPEAAPTPSYADMNCATVEVLPAGARGANSGMEIAGRISLLDPRLAARMSGIADEILAAALTKDPAAGTVIDPSGAVLDWLASSGMISEPERRSHQTGGDAALKNLAPLLLHLSFSSRDQWVALLTGDPSQSHTPIPGSATEATITDSGAAAKPDAGIADLKPIDPRRYLIQSELGRGGMGVVYKAWDNELKRTVAIKAMSGERSPGTLGASRFQREALACARLRHPHIVQLHDVGSWKGAPALVMDYIEGPTLAAWVRSVAESTPALLERGVRNVKQVADAVAYAHRQGVVHRDIKPENILLDLEGNAYLTDYGLARDIGSQEHLTQTGAVVGTPVYMSPEQAGGGREATHPSTDLYSLGAVLYTVTTGKPPYEGQNVAAVIYQVINQEPEPPRKSRPWVPADLETIIQKSMDKEPQRRYLTAEEMAEDLARYLAGEPIKAVPVGVTTRAWRRMRRHPMLASAAVASMLALAAAVTWAVQSGVEAARQREAREASEAADRQRQAVREQARRLGASAQMTRGEEAVRLYGEALARDATYTDALLGRAREQIELGRFEQALADCDRAITLSPDTVPALLLRGSLLRDHVPGRAADAVKDFQRISEIDPASDAGLLAVALVRAQAGELDPALALLDQAAQRNPKNADTWLARARIGFKKNELPRALKDADRAVQLRPDGIDAVELRAQIYLGLGDRARAIEDVNRVLDRSPQNVNAYRQRAALRAAAGEIDYALADLGRAIELRPDDVELRSARCDLHLGRNDIHAALQDMEEIARSNPGDANSRVYRAKLLVRAGRYHDALEAWNEILPPGGGDGQYHVWRAVTKLLLKDTGGCFQDLNMAVLNPPENERLCFLEVARAASEQNRGDVAETILGLVTRVFHDNHEGAMELGRLLGEKGEWVKATEEFDRAMRIRERLRMSPRDRADTLARLAEAQLRSGRPAEAVENAGKALALAPDHRGALVARALAWIRTGRAAEAMVDLDCVLRADPTDAWAQAVMAEGFRALGDARLAARSVESALALDPALAPAYLCRAELRSAAGDARGALSDLACAAGLEKALAPTLAPRMEELRKAAGGSDDDAYAATGNSVEGKTPEQALAVWSAHLAAHPDDGRARVRRGLLYRDAGRALLARDDFLDAIDRTPPAIEARMALAELQHSVFHDLPAALLEYDRLVRLRIARPELYMGRAQVFLDLKAPSKAIAELGALLLLDRRYVPAYALRASLYLDAKLFSLAAQDLDRSLTLVEGKGRGVDRIDPQALRLDRARARLGLGDAKVALEDLDALLEKRPDDARALVLRAETHLALGARDAAVADARKAAGLSPADADLQSRASLVLGRALIDQGDLQAAVENILLAASHGANLESVLAEMEDKALASADLAPWMRVLDAVLETQPESAAVREARLRACLFSARWPDALAECARLAGPGGAGTTPVEPFARLRALLEPIADRTPREEVARLFREQARGEHAPHAAKWLDWAVAASAFAREELIARAALAKSSKRFVESARDLERVLAKSPEDKDTLLEFARTLAFDLHDGKRAIGVIDKALPLVGKDGPALAQLGRACTNVGDADRAIQIHSLGAAADPGLVDNFSERAQLYLRRSEWAKALADLDRVLALQKDNLDRVYREMAECHKGLGHEAEEEKHRTLAVQAAPGNMDLLRDRAVFYVQHQRFKECKADAAVILQRNDEDAHAHYLIGTADFNLGTMEEAAAEFRKAIEQREHFPEAHYNLACSQARLNDWPGALISASRVVQLSPKWAEAWDLRGQIQLALEHADDALADLRHAVQLKPEIAARVEPSIKKAEAMKAGGGK